LGDNFSDEQSKIIYSDFSDIAIVKAYAGTGKSFTLKQFCSKHKEKKFLYFVYNKSMRIDAQKSFKSITNVTITTFHGIAFQVVGKNYKARLDKEESLKTFDLIRFVDHPEIEETEKSFYAFVTLKTIRDFTSSSLSIEEYISKNINRNQLDEITDEVSLRYALSKIKFIWNEIIKVDNISIPFEHDFYLKLFQLEKLILNYDYILVDEAQDVSHVMIDIILTQRHAKKIFVGDTYQSIYSFRGAVNSLEYLEKNYKSSVYYLSRSFRCPPKVAWIANRIIKLAGATQDFVGVATPAPVTKHKTYIARTNSGLFSFCVENLDKKIYFVGGIKSYNFQDILDIQNLISKKNEWVRNEFISQFSDFKELNKYARDMNDVSLLGVIGIVLKHMKSNIYDLIKTIKESATNNEKESDFTITTAHKSKGLEWSQVELLDDFPFSNEKKMERVNISEELRLLYVAVTRAQNNVKIPESILEYLDVESGSEYAGSAVSVSSAKLPQEEDEEEYDEDDKICFCKSCLDGILWKSGRIVRCDNCDFQISNKKIIGFFSTFDKKISKDNIPEIISAIILKGKYQAKELLSKQGNLFDANIVFENHETYGWRLTFSKEVSKQNNIENKNKSYRSMTPKKPKKPKKPY